MFFAYIGFDAISTTAEECVDPSRDLPRGIMYAIIICTVLYILVALVLTGMVNYAELGVGDPLAFVFDKIGLTWFSAVIAISAVVAMTGVLLVFQLGQPRIWMSMSRDGLLPKRFAKIHPKHQTPSFATIVTGFVVVIPTLIIPSDIILDLCSMGTLFAFVLVCGGVLKLQNDPNAPKGKFKTPYINAKFIMPGLTFLSLALTYAYANEWLMNFIFKFNTDAIPMLLFFGLVAVMTFFSVTKNLSLIPVLGLIFCFYMMAQIHISSWIGFFIWLCVGLVVYFGYSYKNSGLANKSA